MKTYTLTFFCLFFLSISSFSQLPYSKLIGLSHDELIAKKFKYEKYRNQYVLNHSDGLNTATNVLTALSGVAATFQPSEKDYQITLQYGQGDSVSSLTAIFYSADTYNEIQTWLAENNIQAVGSGSGKIAIEKFSYKGLNIVLRSEAVIQSEGESTGGKHITNSSSTDTSYTTYTYTIYTGVEPVSEWHTKEQIKKDNKKAKGKKADLEDMF